MGRVGRKRQHHSIRDNKRAQRTRARTRDLDQVFEDMKKSERVAVEKDEALPGMGQYYCVECARHFISEETLAGHRRTKLHKKRVKVLTTEQPYSQKEAELAAGLKTDNGPLTA